MRTACPLACDADTTSHRTGTDADLVALDDVAALVVTDDFDAIRDRYEYGMFRGDCLLYGRVRDGKLEFEGLFEPWE